MAGTLIRPINKHFSQVSSQPLKVVAIGDSTVYGYGDPEGGGWVERLRREWMRNDGPVLYNLGIRGDRLHQVTKRLEIEFNHRGELRNSQPDLLIISVGLNDAARVQKPHGRNYTDFVHFQDQLKELLDLAQSLCPVLFVGMIPVNPQAMPFQGCLYYNHDDQYHYKEATRIACLQRTIPYLDLWQKWLNHGEHWWQCRLSADGLHPNTLGYQTIFQDVINWDAIADIHDKEILVS